MTNPARCLVGADFDVENRCVLDAGHSGIHRYRIPAASPPSLDAPAEIQSSSTSTPIRDDQEGSKASTTDPHPSLSVEMYQRLAAERPLDTHVSTHIMGWHLSHDGLNHRWTDDKGNWRKYITDDSWSPSTNIRDAWEVVEAMKGDGRSWSLHFHTVMSIAENYDSREVSAALCRAALRAVGCDDA